MGMVIQNGDDRIEIPAIQSLLRTLVLPLSKLFQMVETLNDISICYRRRYRQILDQESSSSYLDALAEPENHLAEATNRNGFSLEIPVLNLDTWRDESVEFLMG